MIETHECIEDDTTRNALISVTMPLDLYPLELHLEMQEEIAFQDRLKKESEVVAKIRQIAQVRLKYNQEWIDSIENKTRNLEDCMKTFLNPDVFLKMTKKEKENLKLKLGLSNFLSNIEFDRNFFKNIVDKIDDDIPYLIEVLYIQIYIFNARERSSGSKCSSQNTELFYLSTILKMLDPFLTREFDCFFLKIKDISTVKLDEKFWTAQKINLNNSSYLNINSEMMQRFHLLWKSITNRFAKQKTSVISEIEILVKYSMYSVDAIIDKIIASDLRIKKELQIELQNGSGQCVDFTMLPCWREIRSNFSVIYNLLRKAEEVNCFLDDLMLSKKIKAASAASPAPKESIKEVVEEVPALDDVFLEESVFSGEQQDRVMDFFKLKKQQLFLWQERVKQRKEQRIQIQQSFTEHGDLKEPEMDVPLDRQHAGQIECLYKKIDEADKVLYYSLFQSDASCKPHNVRFQHIEKLIKNFGGALKNDTGSSHFSVHLPDTYPLWTENNMSSALSYMDIPEVTGGSYKPHGHSEEWTRSAHDLLKKAFIKAGITPERLVRANQIMRI